VTIRMAKQILCISLSPIARDSRVLRQISLLAKLGDVTTVGYGAKPDGATNHLEVPSNLKSLPQTLAGVARLLFRDHNAAENSSPAAAWILKQELSDSWDLVVANDARVLDLADQLSNGAPIWADMHEWAPEEQSDLTSWRILVAPFMTHLCEKYLPSSSLVTTVSSGIAELYGSQFGVNAHLFTNASELRQIEPSPVEPDRIRCVHSGIAVHSRGLDRMVELFTALPERYTLDLYLVPGSDGGAYLQKLRNIFGADPRITFNDPVLPRDLPDVLSGFDVGVYWIPPLHTNARLSFPNKFFDFVQARLAIAIGPSEEMAREVDRFKMGVISDTFEPDAIAKSVLSLTPERVDTFKQGTAVAAQELNFERQAERIERLLKDLLL